MVGVEMVTRAATLRLRTEGGVSTEPSHEPQEPPTKRTRAAPRCKSSAPGRRKCLTQRALRVPLVDVICDRCGRNNPENLAFCQDCGRRLTSQAGMVPPTPPAGLGTVVLPGEFATDPARHGRPSRGAWIRLRPPREEPHGPVCPACSTQNPETNRFCVSCGARLPTGLAPIPPQPARSRFPPVKDLRPATPRRRQYRNSHRPRRPPLPVSCAPVATEPPTRPCSIVSFAAPACALTIALGHPPSFHHRCAPTRRTPIRSLMLRIPLAHRRWPRRQQRPLRWAGGWSPSPVTAQKGSATR